MTNTTRSQLLNWDSILSVVNFRLFCSLSISGFRKIDARRGGTLGRAGRYQRRHNDDDDEALARRRRLLQISSK